MYRTYDNNILKKIKFNELNNIKIFNKKIKIETDIVIKNIKNNKIKKLLVYGNRKTGKTELIKYIAKETKKDIYIIDYFTIKYNDLHNLQNIIYNISRLSNNDILYINICENILSDEEVIEYINGIILYISNNNFSNIFVVEFNDYNDESFLFFIEYFDYFIKTEIIDIKNYIMQLSDKYNINLSNEIIENIYSISNEPRLIHDIIKKLSVTNKDNYNIILNRYKELQKINNEKDSQYLNN